MTTVSSLGSSQISSEISTVETRLQAPITALDAQVTTDKADISAWGNISGSISTLSKSLAGIADVSTINSRTVNSTTPATATATATNSAATGTYDLTNVTLAKTQEIYSALMGSGAATLSGGAGSLSFTLKNGKTESVSVGSGSLTLNGVAAAINKVAGGVQASVIGTAAGARLVLQSSATGSSQAFSVAGTGALAQFSYTTGSSTGGETLAQTASDAKLSLNGVPVTSTTNSLSSAISGLSLSLAGSGNTTVTVSSAPTSLSAAVSSVASSLNSALSMIAKETRYVPAGSASASGSAAKSGPLLGNFTATDLSNQLLNSVSAAAASGLSANAIGFSVSSAGTVSFSSTKFSSAYAKNPTGVQNLVGQIYKTLDSITTGAIGGSGTSTNSTGTTTKNTGSIGAQTTSLQSAVTSVNAQVTEINKENAAQLKILLAEYTTAENASTSASITQSYLSIFNSSSTSSGG
jgi:flagellar hook-associated protein 2